MITVARPFDYPSVDTGSFELYEQRLCCECSVAHNPSLRKWSEPCLVHNPDWLFFFSCRYSDCSCGAQLLTDVKPKERHTNATTAPPVYPRVGQASICVVVVHLPVFELGTLITSERSIRLMISPGTIVYLCLSHWQRSDIAVRGDESDRRGSSLMCCVLRLFVVIQPLLTTTGYASWSINRASEGLKGFYACSSTG